MSLKAIVIDDEEFARKNLTMMLEEHCADVTVIGEAEGKEEAKELIDKLSPDVIFLDIRMPSGSEGFELLEEVTNKNFLVVFVTAFKDYAIRAFNASAVYYILKPIDIEDLQVAVTKVHAEAEKFQSQPDNYSTYFDSLKTLSDNIVNKRHSNRIAISHTKGLKIIDDADILHLEASGNCTTIYFVDGTRYLDTRTLKTYEGLLNPDKFSRIHKSHIINLDLLKEYLNEDGHFAVMDGGKRVPVARNRVTEFVRMLKAK